MSRVLVVTNDFPPRQGGIETFVASLCKEMDPGRVVVHTARMPGSEAVDASLPYPVVRDPSRVLIPSPAVARRVRRTMREFECDRVLFGAAMPLALLASTLRRAGARRLVAMTHGHEVWWSRVPVARAALRRVGDEVDVLTYVSDWCRARIAGPLSHRGRARMHALSPGLDPRLFRPSLDGSDVRQRLGIAQEQRVVLCLARMTARKGQDTLVRAWPAVQDRLPDAVLVLVGDGRHRRAVEKLAEELRVAGAVRFVGGLPHAETAAFFAAADLFAMPCRTRRFGLEPEAFGIVFLEAQACGLPVIIGRSGGAPETLQHPGAGLIVEPQTASVAQALVDLLDVQAAADAARANADTVRAQHSWDGRARRLLRYLEMD